MYRCNDFTSVYSSDCGLTARCDEQTPEKKGNPLRRFIGCTYGSVGFPTHRTVQGPFMVCVFQRNEIPINRSSFG
jgi:hypothetical protein